MCLVHLLLKGVEPPVDHRAQRAGRFGRGGQPLGEPTVDGLQLVQRGLRLGDLDLGGGEPGPFGAFGEPACEEGLAGPVLSANSVEGRATRCDRGDPLIQGGRETVQAHREQVESCLRHGAAPQGVDDLAAASGADGWRAHTLSSDSSNCSRSVSRLSLTLARESIRLMTS